MRRGLSLSIETTGGLARLLERNLEELVAQLVPIELVDGRLSLLGRGHGDEAVALGYLRDRVGDDLGGVDLARSTEKLRELVLSVGLGEVEDKQARGRGTGGLSSGGGEVRGRGLGLLLHLLVLLRIHSGQRR